MKTYLFLFSILIAVACNSDDSQNNRTPLTTSCCQNDPVTGEFGDAKVYIPNVFTPNHDGRNDFFQIFTNIHVSRILLIDIRTSTGTQVFSVQNLDPQSNASLWDGTVNGVVKKGIYKYSIILENIFGTSQEFTGRVCNFPCSSSDSKESFFDSFENCHTSSQYDLAGGLDETRPTGEEWDCLE